MEREKVLEDFNKRSQEVSDYFAFIREVEQQRVRVIQDGNVSRINSGLDKTLKATGYLLLYNLVESTMRNAIELIFDEIQTALPKVWCKKYNRLHIQKGGLRRRPKVIVFSSKSTLRLTPPTRYKFFL